MKYNIQANSKNVYFSSGYINPRRWASYSKIIDLVLEINPKNILEIGPGNKIVTEILQKFGFAIKTLDFDEKVNPDYLMDIRSPETSQFRGKFDLIIISEVLEHIEYADFEKVLGALRKITNGSIILTLPFTTLYTVSFHFQFKLPFISMKKIQKKIIFKKEKQVYNGNHYWEIGKIGYPLSKIKKSVRKAGWNITDNFFPEKNFYHYFFILK